MKNILVLLVAALAAAALAFFLTRPGARVSDEQTGKLLAGFAPEKVAGIRIESADGTVNLALKEGVWQVVERDGYPADAARVGRLLRAMWDLEPVQTLPITPESLGRLGLEAPGDGQAAGETTGTVVVCIDQSGSEVAALVLGKRHMNEGAQGLPGMSLGRYVRKPADSTQAALAEETFDEALGAPQLWIDKQMPPVGELSTLRVSGDAVGEPYELRRENESWQLADLEQGEQADQPKLASVANALEALSVADLGPGEFTERGSVEVRKADGSVWVLTLGEGDASSVPARLVITPPDGVAAGPPPFGGRSVLVPAHLAENLLKKRAELLVPPAPSPTPTPEPPPKKPAKSTRR